MQGFMVRFFFFFFFFIVRCLLFCQRPNFGSTPTIYPQLERDTTGILPIQLTWHCISKSKQELLIIHVCLNMILMSLIHSREPFSF